MGQAECHQLGDVAEDLLLTPPESGKRRALYLDRLGIRNGKLASGPDSPGYGEENNLISPHSAEEIAKRQLSYENIFAPLSSPPRKHQTVTIFDWDDTLICTSALSYYTQDETIPIASASPLARDLLGIEAEGLRLLEAAKDAGEVFIITNALPEWIEWSAATYVPRLVGALRDIPVLSARGQYETQFPGERGVWKEQAFLQLRRQLNPEIVTNLISVGDSTFEMDAVHVLGREFSEVLVKTIKFRDTPNSKELHKELELVASRFGEIVNKAQNLKISLERLTPTPSQDKRQSTAPRSKKRVATERQSTATLP